MNKIGKDAASIDYILGEREAPNIKNENIQ